MEDYKSIQLEDIVTDDIHKQNNTVISDISLGTNNNLNILYITFIIIIGVLILWILIVIYTREDPIKVLSEMTNLATHIKPVTDTLM
jgi:hypothetical protein